MIDEHLKEEQARYNEEHERNCRDLFGALRNARLGLLKELHGCIEQMNRVSLIQFGRNHSSYDRSQDLVHELWKELEVL